MKKKTKLPKIPEGFVVQDVYSSWSYQEFISEKLKAIIEKLDRLEAVVESLKYKDAEVIDLDKAVTDVANGIGAGDFEEVGLTKRELVNLVGLVEKTNSEIRKLQLQRDFSPRENIFVDIEYKLNKMLNKSK